MTTRDENRAAVWSLLAQHGNVTWHGYGQDVAFADEVLELAARLGRVETVPAMRPARVASPAAQKAAYREASEAIAAAKERRDRHVPLDGAGIATGSPVSDEQGVAGVPDSGQQRATKGDGQ